MLRRILFPALLYSLPCAFLPITAVCSAQEPKEPAQKEPAKNEPAQKEPASTEEELDKLFTLPEGDDVAALAKFLRRLADFEPTTRTEQQLYRRKAPLAMRKAAEKILTLEKDQKSPAWRLAQRITLQNKAKEVTGEESTDAARRTYLKDLAAYLESSDKSGPDAELALNFAMDLEFLPARELAAEAYAKLGTILAESKDPQAARYGKMLAGAGRRLNLVGQPLALKGTTVDGKPFDLESLKGKVVLVDFWATWCGPCLAEVPNIKKNCEKYREKGFEVVGVSIDQDREALEQFLEDSPLPWPIVHDKENEGRHPATTELGIFAIPCVILVNKEGKVVSTNARGADLGTHLEDLFAAGEKK